MTDTESVLSIGQQRRIQALNAANVALRTSGFFQSNQPKDAEELIKLADWIMDGVEDDPGAQVQEFGPAALNLKTYGEPLLGTVYGIDPSNVSAGFGVLETSVSFGEFVASLLERDCGNPDCLIHGVKVDPKGTEYSVDPDPGPADNELEDDDLRADDTGTDEGQERPDDTEAGDPGYKWPGEADLDRVGMAESSDFSGGEADTANEEPMTPAANDHDNRPTFD